MNTTLKPYDVELVFTLNLPIDKLKIITNLKFAFFVRFPHSTPLPTQSPKCPQPPVDRISANAHGIESAI